MVEPPSVVSDVLDRYPSVVTEVSFRAGQIAPGGQLDPAWREAFRRHPDRFLIGSDTYVTSRWGEYSAIIDEHRGWLAQLPADVAQGIAYRNADRIFGGAKDD